MESNDLKRKKYISKLKASPFMFASELGRRLEKGEIPAGIIAEDKLEALLKEFDFEEALNDFKILVEIIKVDFQEFTEEYGNGIPDFSFNNEMVLALNFLYNNDNEKIFFELKHISKMNKVIIRNPYLIELIRITLLNKYLETNIDFSNGIIKEENITDWGGYFESESQSIKVRKGRANKNEYLGFCVQEIFIFLQKYTFLKAPKGTLISRRQASFIYKFLDLIGIIKDKLSWEEDNIRHILKAYNKRDSVFWNENSGMDSEE